MLVLGALGFRDRKETDVLQLICSVSLIAKRSGFENEDEHKDDSSNSEFRLNGLAQVEPMQAKPPGFVDLVRDVGAILILARVLQLTGLALDGGTTPPLRICSGVSGPP